MPRAAAPRPPAEAVPLLMWDELKKVEDLRAERAALIRRMAAYPPFSHRHVRLEAQLNELTARVIAAELELARKTLPGRC